MPNQLILSPPDAGGSFAPDQSDRKMKDKKKTLFFENEGGSDYKFKTKKEKKRLKRLEAQIEDEDDLVENEDEDKKEILKRKNKKMRNKKSFLAKKMNKKGKISKNHKTRKYRTKSNKTHRFTKVLKTNLKRSSIFSKMFKEQSSVLINKKRIKK